VGKVVEKLDGASSAGSTLSSIQTRFDLMGTSEPKRARTDFTAIFPQSNGDSFQLGLFDAFEGNKFTAQIGRKIDDNLGIRYGVFASKPGLGVDYSLGSRLSLRGDLFSLNDPRLDLRFRYDFGKGVIGWFGMDRAFKDNAPLIGLGIAR
jgi:phospholipid/cholesterol/gamma-HCH transport system substrate-binding protein